MGWRLVYAALLLAISCALSQNLDSDGCIASFADAKKTPNEELMNALYAADPDTDTGKVVFVVTGLNTANAQLDSSTLTYTNWLSRSRDFRKDMVNLWFYLARLMTTDLVELAYHYESAARLGNNKPRGVIDFTKLYDLFNQACTQYIKVHFWMTCFNTDFYCSFKDVLSHQNDVIKNGPTLKSVKEVVAMSLYGIDNDKRAIVLGDLFHENITKYIPEQVRKDVFYQSDLVSDSIDNLLLGKLFFRDWVGQWKSRSIQPVRQKMIDQCATGDSTIINRDYYCVGKRFMDKIESCSQRDAYEDCLFDPLVQDFFTRSGLDDPLKLSLLPQTISRAKAVLLEFNTNIKDNNARGLRSLNNKYAHYITVADSSCSLDWMRRFDCKKNWGCLKDEPEGLDCTRGDTTCKLNTMYRFDCMISFILKPSQRLVASISNVILQEEAKVWLGYPPMVLHYPHYTSKEISTLVLSVQKRAKPHVLAYDAGKLKIYIQYLPSTTFVPSFAFKKFCIRETIETRYVVYCNLNGLFESIGMYMQAFAESTSKSIVLNPTVNYVTLIEQLHLQRVQNFLNAQMAFYFNDITSQLEQNFSDLASYFSSLANFDKQKATADIDFISGKLDDFSKQMKTLTKPISDRFSGLFKAAFAAGAMDIAEKAVVFGIRVAEACNPFALFTGGAITGVMEASSAMMQSTVNVARIARLLDDVRPALQIADTISHGFAKNAVHLATAKKLIDGLKDPTKDMTTEANTFLTLYNDYSPAVAKSQIVDYSTKLVAFSEQLCERAFEGSTSAAAMIEIGIASSGVCNLLTPQIVKLSTLFEQMYDYQFDLMDSLAAATRAYLASRKATAMTSTYTSGDRVNVDFLSRMALNSFIVSTLHVWTIVAQYCDQLTYLKGGAVPSQCKTAVQVPSPFNVGEVLGLRVTDPCTTSNEIVDYVNIPTKSNKKNVADRIRDKGFIDLEKLYSGQVIEFEVPNLKWLKDNKWVTGDAERVMFVRRFSLHLPPMSGRATHTVELSVEHGGKVQLAPGGRTSYILPVSGLDSRYSFRYKENSPSCFGEVRKNPYDLCGRNVTRLLCVISNGKSLQEVPPTIYNMWKIKATIINRGEIAPNATTDFKLKAALTYCEVELDDSVRTRRDIKQPEPLVLPRQKRTANHWCCSSPKYWNAFADSCSACPTGSSPQLNGYYCQ